MKLLVPFISACIFSQPVTIAVAPYDSCEYDTVAEKLTLLMWGDTDVILSTVVSAVMLRV